MSIFKSQLVTWYQSHHSGFTGNNYPTSDSSKYLKELESLILAPVSEKFGVICITYGFTSPDLVKYISKHSPSDTAPRLDQHASMELNSRGNRICKRNGAACDFYVTGYERRMDEIAKFIARELPFDRLYFYGKDKPIPIHISIGPESSRYALIRKTRSDGPRVNGKSAKGQQSQLLFNDL